jgi:SulP family sulfate permease
MAPFLGWLGELRDRRTLRADVTAGISVALVLVPQSMAYAQLAGLPAHLGLYAAFLPPAIAALFGSSRHLSTGPVAMVSLIAAATLANLSHRGLLPPDGAGLLAAAAWMALLAGAFLLAVGAARLGALVNLISHPVVIGFTSAAALIIGTSQLSLLCGVQVEKAAHHYETVWRIVCAAFERPHWPTLAMSAFAFATLAGVRRWNRRLPNVLIAAAVTSVVAWLSGYGGRIVGPIAGGLPSPHLPRIDPVLLPALLPGALTIALIGLLEAVSISKAVAASSGQRIDVNQELIGQGLANLSAGLLRAFPVSGSFSRTAVNHAAGAVTGFSSVVASLAVGAVLLWLTPLLHHLPQATLAAIIVAAVVHLVRVREMLHAWRIHPHDGFAAFLTFGLTLWLAPDFEIAIPIGVGATLALYIYRTMYPHLARLSRHPDGTLRDARNHGLEVCRHILVLRFDAGLYFGNAHHFEDLVLGAAADAPEARFVVIDGGGINRIDASGEYAIRTVLARLRARHIDVGFADIKKTVYDTLDRAGLVALLGAGRFFPHADAAVQHAWRTMGCDHADRCPLRAHLPSSMETAARSSPS